jgi:hypothetical protein
MDTYPMIRKYLVVGIIFLFMGVSIAPSINSTIVNADQDNDLVDVSIQVCGMKGFRASTVTLTRQQYTDVEKIFDDFQVQLKTVNTKQEALPIYTTTLRSLYTYGLLPEGMNVEQAQTLLVDGYAKEQGLQIFENFSHETSAQKIQHNICCLVAGVVQDGYATGLIGMIGMILQMIAIMTRIAFFALIGNILLLLSEIIVTVVPIALMQGITLFEADLYSVGLLGFKHHTLPYNSGTGKIYGFNGIKLTNIQTGEIRLLGFAAAVLDFSHDSTP